MISVLELGHRNRPASDEKHFGKTGAKHSNGNILHVSGEIVGTDTPIPPSVTVRALRWDILPGRGLRGDTVHDIVSQLGQQHKGFVLKDGSRKDKVIVNGVLGRGDLVVFPTRQEEKHMLSHSGHK